MSTAGLPAFLRVLVNLRGGTSSQTPCASTSLAGVLSSAVRTLAVHPVLRKSPLATSSWGFLLFTVKIPFTTAEEAARLIERVLAN